ncbi:2Fe-2S iron-sulfur cluster-binding protein [Actinophytocola algeriensis]|uniref:3-ketosteroid 9alpha-monooxygenase subunit B n=1 Tax=Actinophytocola algeriensis TaxID=1768010 RepID=A0A7W7PZA6_9PSEU|nr:3-ketosteroid 9alpha-monooxygenase subunit B [Actinophytocola algeriensis]MBE1477069.1 3-ketosteroid 9alpha-monooxygenase subunit B [Actinophytocola algeriensis]
MTESYLLRVREVVQETPDACSVVFDSPGFDYRPGQFLTLRIPSDRCGSVARCYSLSSSPHTDDALRVTVKRTADGYGSNWICDSVTAGDELESLAPAGIFTPSSLDEDLLLFAAGSGITPVMSIVKSALASGSGRVVLVYANRDDRSVIFARALAALAAEHPSRLVVHHWLESVQGLPTAAALTELARPYSGHEVFICGPAPYMTAVRSALSTLDVPRTRVHLERFKSLGANPFEKAAPVTTGSARTAAVKVTLDGTEHQFDWPADTKLLDLLLDRGLDAPYSCREGACSACACRLVSGEVKMLNNDVLEEEDLADGIRLACQSLPVTDEVEISYE